MKYRLAIFDMDGTILYTLEDLKNALNYALRKNGFPERTLEETRRFVGNGRMRLIERAVPEGTAPSVTEALFCDLDGYYRRHCLDCARPYDGVPELLRSLRGLGIKTAVSSNKADSEVRTLAGHFFPGLFDLAAGDREGLRRKPYPDGTLEIMKTLGATPEETVFVGDSDVDIDTARAAGVASISVCWGFRDEAFLKAHGAEILARTPDEVLAATRKYM